MNKVTKKTDKKLTEKKFCYVISDKKYSSKIYGCFDGNEEGLERAHTVLNKLKKDGNNLQIFKR